MSEKCPTCGGSVVVDFRPGQDAYADTPGGHADRHTLVIEAAERALEQTRIADGDDEPPALEAS